MQYVQLSADGSAVVTWYAGPQRITADKPGYAEVSDDDPRYLAFAASQAKARPTIAPGVDA